jgi:hypothetical protein
MSTRALYSVILSAFLAVNSAYAQCSHEPAIFATVRVEGCVAATFGATDTMFTLGPNHAIGGTDTWPM